MMITFPSDIAEFITDKMAEYQVPGACIGLLTPDGIAVRGFGVTNVDHPQAVSAETIFQIGSNTKTMTATLLMMMAEVGQLDLDAPICKILPDFRVADETVSAEATVRQLLTHSTGWVGDHFIDTGSGEDAIARYVASMGDLPQLAPPGVAFSYNNAAFVVAGRIIEVVTGQSYARALQERLFAPLGMANSFFEAGDVMVRSFVVGHDVEPEGEPKVAKPWPLPRALYAAGAVAATAGDMMTYAQFYLDKGRTADGRQLISPDGMTALWEEQFPMGSNNAAVAHSWFVEDVGGVRSYRHGGVTVGQVSAFRIIPDKQFAFVALTNCNTGGQLNQAVERFVLKELCGIELASPKGREPTSAEIAQLVGRYDRPISDFVLSEQDGRLMGQTISKQGFPTADTPLRPPSPLFPCQLLPNGDLIVSEGQFKGAQAQIIRHDDGEIGWIRLSLRLYRRV